MNHKTQLALAFSSLALLLSSCAGPGLSSTVLSASPDYSVPVSSSSPESSTSTSPVPVAAAVYCSPDGSTDPDGTDTKPYNIYQAVLKVRPGQTLYLLDGEYKLGSTVTIDDIDNPEPARSTEEMKTMRPLNYGKVRLNFSQMAWSSSNRGLKLDASYWHLYGLEVFGAGDNGIYISGNHNIVENCVTHDNGDTGLQLGRMSSSQNTIDQWPSYNLIKNCTSYDNHDPKGEDSDGFACKLTTGVGNVFDGCIAYNNVDDGWDLYSKGESGPIGPVTIRNCVAFNNGVTSAGVGTSNSDGNGFKLGGEQIPVNHVVENCVAFNNLATGFTDNSNPGTISLSNCTSFNNGVRDADAANFDLCRDPDTCYNRYRGLLSFSTKGIDFRTDELKNFNSKDRYQGVVEESVFYYGKSFFCFDSIDYGSFADSSARGTLKTATSLPFASTAIPDRKSDIHSLLRDSDGNVALGEFLKVEADFVAEIFGRQVSLGADLSGGAI